MLLRKRRRDSVSVNEFILVLLAILTMDRDLNDRDLNAADNILTRARLARSYASGDSVRFPTEEAIVVEAGTRYSANGLVGIP